MPNLENCPICKETVHAPYRYQSDGYEVPCPRCGKFLIVTSALPALMAISDERQKANMSGWINENQGYEINTYNINNLLKIKTPSFHERADKLLLALEKITEYAGHVLQRTNTWQSAAWCLNEAELNEMLLFLMNTSRIAKEASGFPYYKIVADGWAYLEELKEVNIDSQQGFVAMWFDDSMMNVYEKAIAQGILDAGYKPHLVINREHNGKIDDEIIAQIRRSRFVVADFTGHRGGVYYEAGFAQGLGIEVFWTCRKDDIDNLHFDIRQYNCIDWTQHNLDEFKERIAMRIESVIGHGTYQIDK